LQKITQETEVQDDPASRLFSKGNGSAPREVVSSELKVGMGREKSTEQKQNSWIRGEGFGEGKKMLRREVRKITQRKGIYGKSRPWGNFFVGGKGTGREKVGKGGSWGIHKGTTLFEWLGGASEAFGGKKGRVRNGGGRLKKKSGLWRERGFSLENEVEA